MKYSFGVDVGGTNIKIGLFSIDPFALVEKNEISTPKHDHETSIFTVISEQFDKLLYNNGLTPQDVVGMGLAVPCPVKNGYVEVCPNLAWSQINIQEKMKKYLPTHINVVVSNDANIAAYGENQSLDVPLNNAIFFTLGTGVGGGIIVNGEIVEGRTGSGGEIGHMPIFDGEEVCGCGHSGCLEQKCGTKAIFSAAKQFSQSYPTKIDFENLSVKSIFDAAKLGDKVGLLVVHQVAQYIALSSSILAVSLDPDVIIIGGGIAKTGQFLIDLIIEHYKRIARFGTINVPFVLAKTGNDAGIIGAAKYSIK